ncbi:MarR family winged helix-turn-helix transcriptional regulator [Ramlibacter rhizophilus]|uniref:MarR family transcriptional regulator n=1 Tax=Ramlibacter rhizophilus TaxID=1781167 RepID=A0A4Z0BDN5_9BURK|nr:MarR family transcriptional regulator [Ramlibacter rhizophilus]TFY97416.1 MarR family transcriptional regulator [Ramlibacter rhizophilus]
MRKSVDTVNHIGVKTPGDVLESVHQLMHLVRAHRQREAGGLGHMEGKVLAYFARHPGSTQRDLAAQMQRDKGQLARLVAGLRERGLLEASPDPGDRRSVLLAPSDEGRRLLQSLRRHAGRLSAAAVRGLGADEQETLLALLARVRANLEAAD